MCWGPPYRSTVLPTKSFFSSDPLIRSVVGRGVRSTLEPAPFVMWSMGYCPKKHDHFRTNHFAFLCRKFGGDDDHAWGDYKRDAKDDDEEGGDGYVKDDDNGRKGDGWVDDDDVGDGWVDDNDDGDGSVDYDDDDVVVVMDQFTMMMMGMDQLTMMMMEMGRLTMMMMMEMGRLTMTMRQKRW